MTEPAPETTPKPQLATTADLAILLKRPASDPRVELALRRASDRFRGDVGHPVSHITHDVVWLTGDGSKILHLPAFGDRIHSVVVNGTIIAADTYRLDKQTNAIVRRLGAYWPDGAEIQVDYDHGFQEIPGDIQDAVLEHAATIGSILIHVQQESATSVSTTYGQTATVGTTQKWVDAVERYKPHNGRT